MKIGAKLPTTGTVDIAESARRIEDAGFSSLWVADHIVMTEQRGSTYPFSSDGDPTWDVREPWLEAMMCLTAAAVATSRIELATGVLVAPLRHPIVFAKQAATLDQISKGRFTLGVGGGWYREEFEALGIDFARRGQALDEWMDVVATAWGRREGVASGDIHRTRHGTLFSPEPAHNIPCLVGGMSRVALKRVATRGDGWIANLRPDQLSSSSLEDDVRNLERMASEAGRARPRIVLRIAGSAGHEARVAEAIPTLELAGVDDIVVDIEWQHDDGPEQSYRRLTETVGGSE